MLIIGVLCLGVALCCGALGLWRLFDPRRHRQVGTIDLVALRAMAPAQLAAAVMLAAGGLVALVGPSGIAVLIVVICVAGAFGTLAVGSWRSARFAAREATGVGECAGRCAGCTALCSAPTV